MNAGASPRKWRETAVAATEEITIGLNAARPKSPRMISRANMEPAMGALKVAAMPAAAPQPTRVLIRSAEILSIWPMLEPIADPIWTMGPSLPTEPPVPIHTADTRHLTKTTRFLIIPLLRVTASMTSGTPCPLASLASK